MNSKQKGNIGVGIAIAYFTSLGHIVSIPINDSQDYDLIVDIDGFLYTVQIKYTTEKSTSGHFVVGLRSISGSTKKEYKIVKDTSIDFLFIVTKSNDLYLIPVSDVNNRALMTLNTEVKDKYGVVGEWLNPASC